METAVSHPSPQLLAANQRLHQLRAQTGVLRPEKRAPWPDNEPQAISPDGTGSLFPDTLPAHLGWESAMVTAVLRRRTQKPASYTAQQELLDKLGYRRQATIEGGVQAEAVTSAASQPDWVKLYPDIGLGMLRQEKAAPGRLWLMLRYLDQQGRGNIRIDTMQQTLTDKTSALYLCGKRQLRNLLKQGEGIFWKRDREHIWLLSAARVAHGLDVEQLTGRPVALPVAALLEGIGSFRAHLYAAFHSGRTKETPGGTQTKPIARDTLAGLSGVGASSQRAYETRANVKVQANFAVGEAVREETREERAWSQGRALFELKDYRGQQGKKGKTYLAWQLPNSYVGQHWHRPKGRQKRINRKLKDLVMKGMPGNVGGTRDACASHRLRKPEKVYYPNGKTAAKAHGRNPECALYWQRHRTGNGRFAVWQQLGGQ